MDKTLLRKAFLSEI